MMRLAIYFLLVSTTAFILSACSGGDGSSSGGVGGSGIITQGTITGFGSIAVNGVQYDTDAASIEISERSASSAELGLGMVVTLRGDLNPDGITGTATSVVVDYRLRGRVDNVGLPDSDDVSRSITILGTPVTISRRDTFFDATSFDTIAVDDLVEISGYASGGGDIAATRVARTGTAVAGTSEVELSGSINNLVAGTSFTLRGITVLIDSGTSISGPLENGQQVEVEGILQAGFSSVLAQEVEPEDDGLPDNADDVEIEGIVTSFTSIQDFTVSGISVNASGAEFEPPSLATTLTSGQRIEVEGDIVDGALIADEVKSRSGSILIESFIDSTDVTDATVSLELAPGQFVTINTGPSTIFKDDRDEVLNFGLNDLVAGDYVIIRASQSDTILASELQRKGPEDKMKVTANIEASTFADPNGTVTVLGVVFSTTSSTDFERDASSGDESLSASEFYSDPEIVSGTAQITLEDEFIGTVGDGVADEVEIKD